MARYGPPGHWLGREKSLFWVCLPGEITELKNVQPPALAERYVDGLLDPVRGSRAALEESRRDLGGKDYSGQILQHPAAMEGTLFKRKWWRYYDDLPPGVEYEIVHSWDTDYGKNKASSAGIRCRVYPAGVYITGICDDSLEYPDLVEQVQIEDSADPCHACLIEDKASGQSLLQTLGRDTKIPCIPIEPYGDKVARAHAITPFLESGNVFLPRRAPWVARFVELFAGFPDIKKKDLIDAFTQLINWIREKRGVAPVVVSASYSTVRNERY